MTRTGGRRRVWRWAVGAWAALVVTGGGLTLSLQDANEPAPPARWEKAPDPSTSADAYESGCPLREYTASPTPTACAYVSR